jgi:uncharacterized protein YccT (UPF0319 family)
MNHLDTQIKNIDIQDTTINIDYENDEKESLIVSQETYEQMYQLWLKETPVFITDKYKTEIRNITFAAIQKKEICINQLNNFFKKSNEENVKAFLIYMRHRKVKIQQDKDKLLKKT